MNKAFGILVLALVLTACGGGAEDDGGAADAAYWEGVSLSDAEKATLAGLCTAQGAALVSFTRAIVIEADGRHHYVRGTCSNGQTVQFDRL
jgi:hypothetical protein